MEEYTKFRNKNRGYMKLRVWHKAIELYKLVCRIVYKDNKIEFKLRAQIADAAQSVSSNISVGNVGFQKSNDPTIQRSINTHGSLK
ncbi:MAG: four helix bundle protein [bacterium]